MTHAALAQRGEWPRSATPAPGTHRAGTWPIRLGPSPPPPARPRTPCWPLTNEKTLIDRAGLRDVDAILAGLTAGPATLRSALDQAEALLG